MADLQALLTHIVRHMVDEPDAVRVESTQKEDSLQLELTVAPGDVGKVIGRGGSIAKDLRSVVRAAAPLGQKVMVEISNG